MNTKIKMVPAMRKAKVEPTNEDATFFKNDMKSGFCAKVYDAPLHAPHFYPILLNEPKALHWTGRQHGQPPRAARRGVE